MSIRWANVAMFALLIFGTAFFVNNHDDIHETFSSINDIGSSYASQEEQFRGVFVFALIGLVVVAVVKIIVEKNRNDGDDN